MSIRRIESSYAYCLKLDLTGPEMAVLQALAYTANDKRGELCYPSDQYLEQLTHFSGPTIIRARSSLRKRGLIDWIRGSKIGSFYQTNTYRFRFPLVKMPSRHECYESLTEQPQLVEQPAAKVIDRLSTKPSNSAENVFSEPPPAPPTSIRVIDPLYQSDRPPYQSDRPPLSERQTNTKTTQIISQSKSGADPHAKRIGDVIGAGLRSAEPQPSLQVDLEAILKVAQEACKAYDEENAATFRRVMLTRSPSAVGKIVNIFAEEAKRGEHVKLKKPSAELTKRLMKLPSTNSGSVYYFPTKIK